MRALAGHGLLWAWIAALGAGATAQDWGTAGGNPARTGNAAPRTPLNGALTVAWSFATEGDLAEAPLLWGDLVVVVATERDGRVRHLLRARDGKPASAPRKLATTTDLAASAWGEHLAYRDGDALCVDRRVAGQLRPAQRWPAAGELAPPLLVDRSLWFVRAGALACQDLDAAQPKWSTDDAWRGRVSLADDRVFAVRLARGGEVMLAIVGATDGRLIAQESCGLRVPASARVDVHIAVGTATVAVRCAPLGVTTVDSAVVDSDEPNTALLRRDGDALRLASTAHALAAPTLLGDAVLAPVATESGAQWRCAEPGRAARSFGPAPADAAAALVSGDVALLGDVLVRASSGRVLWRNGSVPRTALAGDLLLLGEARRVVALRARAEADIDAPEFDATGTATHHGRTLHLALPSDTLPTELAAGFAAARARWRDDLCAVLAERTWVIAPRAQAERAAQCAAHGDGVVQALAQAFADLLPAPRERVVVELFADAAEFAARGVIAAPATDPARAEVEAPLRNARALGELRGYFAPEPGVTRLYAAAAGADAAPMLATLAHELTHHWLHLAAAAAMAKPPSPRLARAGFWVVEGFATFAESLAPPDFAFGAQPPLLLDAFAHAPASELFPWSRLLQLSQLAYHRELDTETTLPFRGRTVLGTRRVSPAALFAGQAVGLCEFAWTAPERRAALLRTIADYYLGATSSRPLTERLGITAEQLGKDTTEFVGARHGRAR